MKLTAAQRRVLTVLAEAEDALDAGRLDSKALTQDEIVCEGKECWIGQERTSWRLVLTMLRIMALSDRSDQGMKDTVRRFRINQVGRLFLRDESQIDRLLGYLRDQVQFVVKEDGLYPLNPASTRTTL